MEFVAISELNHHPSKYMHRHDWIVLTRKGKPVKVMLHIEGEHLEDLILAEYDSQELFSTAPDHSLKSRSIRNFLLKRMNMLHSRLM